MLQLLLRTVNLFFFNDSQLIHPGEYGKYRENALKDLLSILTSYKIGDGFIITSEDSISTQCDIVIYDNNNLPVLENNFTQFFTIESVIAIGEVKSTLNHTEFKNTLIKLANNKKLKKEINGLGREKGIGDENNSPITFLVCKNLSFNLKNINFDDIYKNVEREFWHDSILIIDQGIYTNNFEFKNLKEPFKSRFIQRGYDIEANPDMPRTCVTFGDEFYACNPSFNSIDKLEKYKHILSFLAGLSQAISTKTLYETQILAYSSLEIANIRV